MVGILLGEINNDAGNVHLEIKNVNIEIGTLDIYITNDVDVHGISFSMMGITYDKLNTLNMSYNDNVPLQEIGGGIYMTINFTDFNGERICFNKEPMEHPPINWGEVGDGECLVCESGDLNEDGVVNLLDNYLLSKCTVASLCDNYNNSDINGDGGNGLLDLVSFGNYLSSWGIGEYQTMSIGINGNILSTTTGACYPCNENYHLVDGECLKIGCTYSNACNYDSSAMYDDGNCIFAEQNYDCDGNCLIAEDVDENGMCDGQLTIEGNNISEDYSISSIYPNPFNPTTTISFSIPELGLTTITSHDINGRKLETLTNENLSIGNYSIDWNASSYPSGVYLIRMDSGDFTQTQKVVLVK